MEAGELARIDEALRLMCRRENLAWVLTSVDAAIDEGSSQSVNPGSSSYRERGRSPWSNAGLSREGEGRSRPQPRLIERPYTQQEQVVILLDAMLAIYRDLPEVRKTAIGTLSNGLEGRVPLPGSIVFIEDEDDPDASTVLALVDETEEERGRRQRVVGALVSLRDEVTA